MSQVKDGDTVKVDYTGKLDDGTVFDTTDGREPLEFTVGVQQVIPGFEQAVVGMSPGESTTVNISPEEGYGPRREELILTVDRDQVSKDVEPEVGKLLQVQRSDGQVFPVTITEVTEQTVTLDANHPLAGKKLTFDIQLVEIG